MFARSVAWLFVARAVQGLATGLLLSAASAALLDLHPRRDAARSGCTTVSPAPPESRSVCSSRQRSCSCCRPRVCCPTGRSSFCSRSRFAGDERDARARLGHAPARPAPAAPGGAACDPSSVRAGIPRRALLVVDRRPLARARSRAARRPVSHEQPPRRRAQRVRPRRLRGSLAVVFARRAPWAAAAAGSVALAVGLLGIVAATASASGPLYLIATILAGAGFGAAFLGALRALSAAIPAEERSAVMSAFYIVAYASLSVPAILAGVLASRSGSTRRSRSWAA